MQNNPANSFFTFTKKEKRGVLMLLITIVSIFVSAQFIYPLILKEESLNSKIIVIATDSLKEKQKDSTKNYYSNIEYNDGADYNTYTKNESNRIFTGSMFYFDPNTLDVEGWQKLGVKEKTIASIQKYISNGGRFRQPDDLRKIWGLTNEEKERLIAYVRIVDVQKNQYANSNSNNYKPYENKEYKRKETEPIDINLADSTGYDALPGIGAGYCKRILKYRNDLGGFCKIEQIKEVYGLPDSIFQKIKPFLKVSNNTIRKIKINNCTLEELKIHPYIRWQLANVIIEYKKQHGDFKNLEELKKIMVINDETYLKISPYLSL